jgi:hypothetical protein
MVSIFTLGVTLFRRIFALGGYWNTLLGIPLPVCGILMDVMGKLLV